MRTSQNEYKNPEQRSHRLWNGYDYHNQAWVIKGRYVRCGHPESMDCGCFGKEYEGIETVQTVKPRSEWT